MRTAIYTRLSKDADGSETATARQEADARAFAQAKGWIVTDVYRDVDLSAYRNVRRPGYEQMLTDIDARQVDGVLVWKLDRLVRSPAEFERFWAACEAANVKLASVNEPVDTSNELGMVVVRILVAFARLESATMSLRLRSVKEASAKAGRPKHGGPRAFGLTRDWTEVVPDEAAMIADAAKRVLAGASLRSIVLEWNAAGAATTTGGAWTSRALRALLLQRRLCGERIHHGQVVAEGQWPTILDRDTCDQLAAVLEARIGENRGRTFLLSGIMRCHKCASKMRGSIASNGRRRYGCPAPPEGCLGTSILADPSDDLVRDMVCDAVDSRDLTSLTGRTNTVDHAARIRADETRLGELAAMWGQGDITRQEWMAARASIEERLAASRRAATTIDSAVGRWVGRGRELRDAWGGMPLDAKRAVVLGLIDRIVVPAQKERRNRYEPDRVITGVEWRS